MPVILKRTLIIALLFLQGTLVGSVVWLWQRRVQESAADNPHSVTELEAEPILPAEMPNAGQIEAWLQLGRQALANAQPFDALPYFLRVVENPGQAIDPRTNFQLALTLESVGEFSQAAALYQRLRSESNGRYVLPAQIGFARCATMQGNTDAAETVFWAEVLDPSSTNSALNGEILHWLGIMLASQIVDGNHDLAQNPNSLLEFPIRLEPDRILKRLMGLESSNDSNSESMLESQTKNPAQTGCVVKSIVHGETLDATIVNASSKQVPLTQVLAILSASLDTEIMISDAASRLVAGIRPSLNVNARSLALLLDGLTLPNGLGWIEQNRVCYVMSIDEMQPHSQRQFQIHAARRMLQLALLESPEHEFAKQSRLAIGDLEYWNGQSQSAISTYRELIQQSSEQGLILAAYFNLGKVYRSIGQSDQAIDAMYRVVENPTTPPEINVAAYLIIGQQQMELDDLPTAIQSFARAAALSNSDRHGQIAALNLAIAYFDAGEAALSLRTIMRFRPRFQDPDLKGLATFVAAYARWKATGGDDVNDELALISAIGSSSNLVGLGPQEPLLYARAFQELGFASECTQMLHAAEGYAASPAFKDRIRLAECNNLISLQRLAAAKTILQSIAADAAPKSRRAAQLELAELAWDEGNLEAAFDSANRIFDEDSDDDQKRTALTILGRVHQKWGNHEKAALCFAGLLPSADSSMENPK